MFDSTRWQPPIEGTAVNTTLSDHGQSRPSVDKIAERIKPCPSLIKGLAAQDRELQLHLSSVDRSHSPAGTPVRRVTKRICCRGWKEMEI